MSSPRKKRYAFVVELPAEHPPSQTTGHRRPSGLAKTLFVLLFAAGIGIAFWVRGGCEYGFSGEAVKPPASSAKEN
jgi:hypothetical protein